MKRSILLIVFICLIFSLLCSESGYGLDLTVVESIKLALKNNFGLQIESQELENRISQVTIEKAFFIPKLNLNTSYNHQEDVPDLLADSRDYREYSAAVSQELPLGGSLSLSYSAGKNAISASDSQLNIHYSEVGLTYLQPLLKDGLAGPIFVDIKDAEFDRDIQKIFLDDIQINLVNRVWASFYQLVRQQRATEINKEILKISDDILSLIQTRFELGRVPELEVMLARIERNKNRQAYLISLQDAESAQTELQDLLGIDQEVKAIEKLERNLTIPSLSEAISVALRQNKQILSVRRQIAKEELAVDVAKNGVLPQVDFFAGYKVIDQGDSYGKANTLNGKEYRAGLLFSYPFHNIALTENLVQARRDLKKLELRQQNLETEITNLSTQLVNELNILQKRIEIYNEQLLITKERLELALKAFERGLILARFLYDARDDLLEAENIYLAVLLERIQKYSALQVLMGNGYAERLL